MERPLVFFDLGQTLINEWDFINKFDVKFLELLNGYGARIDLRNYQAIRDDVVRSRKIGHGGIRELAIEVCNLVLQKGYETVVVRRLEPEIAEGRKNLFRFFDDAQPVLETLSNRYGLGIIANQSEDVVDILAKYRMNRFFKVKVISSAVGLKKPDQRIFQLAIKQGGSIAGECIMVGDRLDTDICPANKVGMKATIRTTNSLFSLQRPLQECEQPTYTVAGLIEIPRLVESIVSEQ